VVWINGVVLEEVPAGGLEILYKLHQFIIKKNSSQRSWENVVNTYVTSGDNMQIANASEKTYLIYLII
jgi:hypothetical protein